MPTPAIAPAESPRFDGRTYDHGLDSGRLAAQLLRVAFLMRDGAWRSLSQISTLTGDPEASISARLRDLRKPRFGAHTVLRARTDTGYCVYRLVPNNGAPVARQQT